MWHLGAIILMIFLIINWPNFVYLLVDPGFFYPSPLNLSERRSSPLIGWTPLTDNGQWTNGQTYGLFVRLCLRWSLTLTWLLCDWQHCTWTDSGHPAHTDHRVRGHVAPSPHRTPSPAPRFSDGKSRTQSARRSSSVISMAPTTRRKQARYSIPISQNYSHLKIIDV